MKLNKIATFALAGALTAGCAKEIKGNQTQAEQAIATRLKQRDGQDYICHTSPDNRLISKGRDLIIRDARKKIGAVIHCEPVLETPKSCPADIILDEKGVIITEIWC